MGRKMKKTKICKNFSDPLIRGHHSLEEAVIDKQWVKIDPGVRQGAVLEWGI